MIKELIKLATHLDERGLTKEADYLDKVIKRALTDPQFKGSFKAKQRARIRKKLRSNILLFLGKLGAGSETVPFKFNRDYYPKRILKDMVEALRDEGVTAIQSSDRLRKYMGEYNLRLTEWSEADDIKAGNKYEKGPILYGPEGQTYPSGHSGLPQRSLVLGGATIPVNSIILIFKHWRDHASGITDAQFTSLTSGVAWANPQ